jgi:hypothetical protein
MRVNPPRIVWGLMLLLSTRGLQADPLSQWTWQFPYPQGNQLLAVTYGGGQFVATGANGAIITSPDGYTWTNQTSGVSANLNGVAYDGNEYAAVGDGGVILMSSNATTWTQIPAVTANTLRGVAGNANWSFNGLPQFLAVGDSGTAAGCNGGTNWSLASTGTSNALYTVISYNYPNPCFLAAGSNGTLIRINAGSVTIIPPRDLGTANDL